MATVTLKTTWQASWSRLVAPVAGLGLSLLLVFALSACGSASDLLSGSDDAQACFSMLVAAPLASGVFVEPDDGRLPIVDEIRAANCSIDVAVYLLSDDVIIEELIMASERGVRVRVMLEEHPFGGGGSQYDTESVLQDGDIEVKWSGSDIRFSHAKYLVVDRQTALILNQNLTDASFERNREFGSVTTDPRAVLQAQQIFDADWEGEPINDADGPLIVSPTSSRGEYLALIGEAQRSIDFYAEVIRDPEIITAIGFAEARGVEVRLIVNESLDDDQQESAAQLSSIGVDIRLAAGIYIHAKLMIIDGRSVVVGSQNFTATSLDDNRELAIVLASPLLVTRCSQVFDRDWIRASPGAPVNG